MSDVKFTGLEMRRTRNPEMERLMHMVNQAATKRETILANEIERLQKQNEVVADVKGTFLPLKEGNKPALPPSGLPENNSEADSPEPASEDGKEATADNTQSSTESDGK